jgi:translation initiation factor IF-2
MPLPCPTFEYLIIHQSTIPLSHLLEISGDERKILMAGLSKRGSAKSSISVSRKPSTKSSDGTGGVKIQVKKKRPIQAPITPMQDDAAVLKAKEALEAGRVADEKLLAQDAKRQEMTRLQKEEAEDLKKQQEQAKQQTEKAKFTRISITSSEVFFNAVDND